MTTFETLGWFEDRIPTVRDLGCVVVDEAHYIKNPIALRSQRATRILGTSDRAILLTGTPLENRLSEFRNLVGYIRPDLVVAIASSEDGLVCLTDLARQLGLTPSNLQHPLRDLVRCGYLSRLPPGDSKRRYYRRTESLAWAFAVEAVSQAERVGLVAEHF